MKLRLTAAILCASLLSCGGGGGGSGSGGGDRLFTIKIENIDTTGISTSNGNEPVVLSAAVVAVHDQAFPIFHTGQILPDNGLETLVESGDPGELVTSLQAGNGIELVGLAQTPTDSQSPGFLTPGKSFALTVAVNNGSKVSLVLGYLQANDIFVASSEQGTNFFDASGNPVSGEVVMNLYDAGTEQNEKPGVGPNQPLSQPEVDSGVEENRAVASPADGFSYPAPASFIRVTFSPV